MGYKLIISEDAHEDVNDIVRHIVHELKSPQAASNFLNDVEAGYKHIRQNPQIYSFCNDKRLELLEYRKSVIKNYLILYRIDEKSEVMYIVRFVYGGRNYPEML